MFLFKLCGLTRSSCIPNTLSALALVHGVRMGLKALPLDKKGQESGSLADL